MGEQQIENYDMESIAARVREYIESHDMSQERFAKLAGMNVVAIFERRGKGQCRTTGAANFSSARGGGKP